MAKGGGGGRVTSMRVGAGGRMYRGSRGLVTVTKTDGSYRATRQTPWGSRVSQDFSSRQAANRWARRWATR